MAVDALDPYVRDELLGDICNKEMTAYTQVFSQTGEVRAPPHDTCALARGLCIPRRRR